MGHYSEQRDYDDYQQELRRDQRLIEEVRSGRFSVILDASDLVNSNTVVVNKGTFSRMLNILSRLDPKTYTYPFQR